jgi:peroxiredoxin
VKGSRLAASAAAPLAPERNRVYHTGAEQEGLTGAPPAATPRSPQDKGERAMAIKVGDRLPDGTLTEMIDTERPGCTVGPNAFAVSDLTKGKKIVVFGVPGAFTPTCSAKHVPSFVQNFDKLRARGVDEIWCVSVNDAFVMGAWGKNQKCDSKVRMMADGSATFTKALGLDMDLTARGMGVRSQRYSMLVDNGVVQALNVEQPGKFEVSDADTMLRKL